MEAGTRGKTYKIGQAAKLLDVKPFVLRFWESEFKDVLVPVRTPAGQRAYSEGNVATVREIKRLLYDEGLTIEGAKKRLGQRAEPGPSPTAPAGAATPPCVQADLLRAPRRDMLRDVRDELLAIRVLLAQSGLGD
jgi:DNA-binding transcriptional MerR regulator